MDPGGAHTSPRPAEGPPRWLVTGGTGAIGPAIVSELAAAGAPVRVLTRRSTSPDDRWPWTADVEVVTGDARDPVALESAMVDVTHVVHAAGVAHRRPRSAREAADLVETNVGLARAMAEVVRKSGAARVVFISSASVYGPTRGAVRDESAATEPETAYGRSKLRAEQVMRAVLGDALTVLRVCAVYGPRLDGQYLLLARAVRSRWPIPVPNGVGHCLISDRDLARLVALVAVEPNCAGSVFNVSDGERYSVSEIVEAMRAASSGSGRWTPIVPRRAVVPVEFVLRRSGGAEWTRRQHLRKVVASVIDGPRLDTSAAAAALPGWSCAPLSVGWRRALDASGAPRRGV